MGLKGLIFPLNLILNKFDFSQGIITFSYVHYK